MEIEYTDRYGGHSPSWLTACHDDCEAMGWVPVEGPSPLPPEGRVTSFQSWGSPGNESRYRAAWTDAHAAALLEDIRAGSTAGTPSHATTCDGWHFVKCPACHGTGRVSRLRTVVRLPRWFARGVHILWSNTRNPYTRAPWTTNRQWYALLVKTAFLYDLGWKGKP
jgi:hypothetical protein